ncbi:hypothetical protein PCURB6_08540 [Paenibacillus curdlanolyticus]|nr:hypothetical protein PCURB6_08540 [Paenibacillus curdlanolyticus]
MADVPHSWIWMTAAGFFFYCARSAAVEIANRCNSRDEKNKFERRLRDSY